jgi:transposase-like protein
MDNLRKAVVRRRDEEEWRVLLEEYKNSNMKIKEFCRQHKLSRQNFHYWQKRLRMKKEAPEVNAFISVGVIRDIETSEKKVDAPICSRIESAMCISFKNGISVEFIQGCKTEELEAVIGVMKVANVIQ